MTITWDTDCNAPGCPGQIVAEDGRSVLIQTDWDYPGVASSFGWSIRDAQRTYDGDVDSDGQEHDDPVPCDHDGTDGTVTCPTCGMTAGEFIGAAADWLTDHDGATADDPGYFDGD